MSPPTPSSLEPASPDARDAAFSAGSGGAAWRATVAEAVVAALGEAPLALLLGGSHASGEAVWITHDGRACTLSDLDLWVVMPDARARVRAVRRLEREPASLAAAAGTLGVVAPIELTVLDPSGLEHLAPRPATLELRACGRVLRGDAGWLARIPDHRPGAVTREEWLLLLENRAFELLWAADRRSGADPLEVLKTRHAIGKVALDLATLIALSRGELPMGARTRVAWAQARLESDRSLAALSGCGLEAAWDEALAWRAGATRVGSREERASEWHRVVHGWVAVWRHLTGSAGADPIERALAVAARAPWPRRLRRSFSLAPKGARPSFGGRLAGLRHGTPQHRLGGAAAVMLFAADASEGVPVLGASARRALRTLAVVRPQPDWALTTRALVHRWDMWVLDGRRGTVAA